MGNNCSECLEYEKESVNISYNAAKIKVDSGIFEKHDEVISFFSPNSKSKKRVYEINLKEKNIVNVL